MKKQGNVFARGALCLVLFFLFGCGYSFTQQGQSFDRRIQKVYVESFANKTELAEMENIARTAFINHLIQYSRFKVVGSAEDADAIVQGAVVHYNTQALSYRPNKLAAEERITITMEIVFREKESGKILWQTDDISGAEEYKLRDDINLLPAARKAAMMKLAAHTAEKAANLMLAGF